MPENLALLLSDVVDSTAMNVALGDVAMARMWQEHDRLARSLIRTWRGREIGRSDGFLLTFDDAKAAVSFAAAYHQSLASLEVPLRARVGIHVGEVELRQNSAEDTAAGATVFDIDGVALPFAARISALARGGQTLISATAKTQLESESWNLASHGHWRIKGIAEPVEVFEVGDSAADFIPPDDGEKAYRVILQEDGWYPAREIRNSVPGERDKFVGRGADLRRLANHLESGARLVSIVGIGGVGKTRLATHFARRWLGEFVGGAWFCDLSEARDVDGIFSAVSRGLDVQLGKADPAIRLAEAIAERGRCLVVLDNFEQVAALATETVGYWLDRAPNAKFIATTRERLGIPGEQVVPLQPLAPEDASSLFARRALANHPEWQAGPEDARAIEELVVLLDGLPLAIELAAGRLGVMTPGAMLTRIGERFTLLSARSGRSRRQATLLATFDWSWDLLTLNERWLLAQASVFAGGFTLEAAENVLLPAEAEKGGAILDLLQSLVDKSFLRLDHERFALLVSVREYAAGKLSALDATASETSLMSSAVEARHGVYYSQPVKGDARGIAELENILVACRRAIARTDLDVAVRGCVNAWKTLETRGPYRLCIELVESALEIEGLTQRQRVPLAYIRGRCLLVSGAPKLAREQLAEARDGARAEALAPEELKALSSLAELDVIEGNLDNAKAQYEEAIRRAAEADDASFHCAAINGLGVYYNRLGQFRSARTQFQLALEVAREAGDRRWEGGALSNLGHVEANLGNRTEAKVRYDEAIVVARQLGDRATEGNLLCNLGLFKLEEGDTESARTYLSRALGLARENGLSLLESVVLCNIGLLNESLGDDPEAEQAYRSALRIARQRGDQRSQGQFLGYLGLLVAKGGHATKGQALLLEGISILRRVKDQSSLAIVLSRYAQGCALWNDMEGGKASLVEASGIAAEIEVATGSELAVSLEAASRSVNAATMAG